MTSPIKSAQGTGRENNMASTTAKKLHAKPDPAPFYFFLGTMAMGVISSILLLVAAVYIH
jgi:hypothetical protein